MAQSNANLASLLIDLKNLVCEIIDIDAYIYS